MASGTWLEEVGHWGYVLEGCVLPAASFLFPGCHEQVGASTIRFYHDVLPQLGHGAVNLAHHGLNL